MYFLAELAIEQPQANVLVTGAKQSQRGSGDV